MKFLKSRIVPIFLVLWPVFLILLMFVTIQLASLNGCKIWARGPSPCLFMGYDFGEMLYPFWALGYYTVFAMFWVIPTGLIWIVIEIIIFIQEFGKDKE